MILDYAKNFDRYKHCGGFFSKVTDFLRDNDLAALPPQKYDLGDSCYVTVMEYSTKETAEYKFESHKKYIDVQYIISGREKILWQNIELGKANGEYNPDKDCAFWSVDGFITLNVSSGMLCALYPEDLHCPSIADGASSKVKKAVFKILAE